MADDNSAQERTNFPVGNEDELPSESPERVNQPKPAANERVKNPEADKAKADSDTAPDNEDRRRDP